MQNEEKNAYYLFQNSVGRCNVLCLIFCAIIILIQSSLEISLKKKIEEGKKGEEDLNKCRNLLLANSMNLRKTRVEKWLLKKIDTFKKTCSCICG